MKFIFQALILAFSSSFLMAADIDSLDDTVDCYGSIFQRLIEKPSIIDPESGQPIKALNLVGPRDPLNGQFLNGFLPNSEAQERRLKFLLLDVEICELLNQAMLGERLPRLKPIYPTTPRLAESLADSIFYGLEIEQNVADEANIQGIRRNLHALIKTIQTGWEMRKITKSFWNCDLERPGDIRQYLFEFEQDKPNDFAPRPMLDNGLYAKLVEKLLNRIGLHPYITDIEENPRFDARGKPAPSAYRKYLRISVEKEEIKEFLEKSGFNDDQKADERKKTKLDHPMPPPSQAIIFSQEEQNSQ